MIHIEGLVTTVKCGRNGKGVIAVGGRANEHEAIFTLQQIVGDINIGDQPTPEQIQDLPSVNIEFYDVESINTYIRILEALKARMNRRMMYAMAC